ncbi:putative BET1 v-SNARE [Zymoseptoria tritici IPO323]|uniref:BET1 v-SNARE n=1 Tax=Zymoseptoria tritici (strain CBS 115943 / IPO323) TaxID=336722 RepID=F9X2I1_ZYMTI|nr:putative BET1 v-SNARE [Zymoseptoria tritici IPO323]EGP90437.1 putative BET1 v-SNARE [Zymoseptoria tritici IPO323]
MASRFQRDSRNSLFSSYDVAAPNRSRPGSGSPAPRPLHNSQPSLGPYGDPSISQGVAAFSAYPGGAEAAGARGSGDGGFRTATPNRRGQYSDSVLSELESQNDDQAGEMSKKVKMLKDLTMAIGDEIRDSTAFAEKMNDQFEGTRNRLRGTMNRMLRMAERTGVGWKVWIGFFFAVFLLFAYVWLF